MRAPRPVAVAVRRCLTGLAATLLLAGCVSLPESGPVETGDAAASDPAADAPYFAPPPPAPGASPGQLAAGFVRAMEANPLTTAVARQYLTAEAARTWRPDRATLVYSSYSVEVVDDTAVVRLVDARRLDDRGAWRGEVSAEESVLRLPLVQEQGEWRISAPPNALVIPDGFFRSRFQRASLYFLDPAQQVLVPEIVYVPTGEQMATRLVRGLLEGPDPVGGSALRSALPAGSVVEFSVPVTGGRAEIALTGAGGAPLPASAEPTAAGITLMAAQLSWTLRQVPEVTRVGVLLDGNPVTLPGDSVDVPVSFGADFDPAIVWASRSLFGLRDGRVVEVEGGEEQVVTGWFGSRAVDHRSLAVDLAGGRLATVSAGGGVVEVSSTRSRTSAAEPEPPMTWYAGADVLKPAWDHYGTLWLVDRSAAGARVLAGGPTASGPPIPVAVPGVTGEGVTAMTVSRDGSRLAAALSDAAGTRVVVSRLERDEQGGVVRATRARPLEAFADVGPAPVTSLVWRSPTTLAALTEPTPGVSQVHTGPVDGSPGSGEETFVPLTFRNSARALLGSPTAGTPLLLDSSEAQLYQLTSTGRWSIASTEVGLLVPTYVG